MKKKGHKIFEFLTHLDSEEFRVFKNYVVAFTNSGSDLSELISYLFANKKMLKNENVSKQLKDYLFPSQTQKNYSNLISKLYLLFQDWMVSYDLLQSQADKELALVRSLNKRGIYKEATRIADLLEDRLKAASTFDLEQSKLLYQLKQYQFYNFNSKTKTAEQIGELVQHFNAFYKEHIHAFNTELYNTGHIRKHDFEQLIKENSNRVDSLTHTRTSELTRDLEKLISEKDMTSFENISRLLLNNKISQATMLHDLCCAYCISAYTNFLRNKDADDATKLLDLYNYGIETKALYREGKLTTLRFSSIISTLSLITSFEQVEKFIKDWVHLVDTKYPVTIESLSMAQNCFFHEKYDDILKYIRGLKYENKLQKFIVMRYELVAIFEQGDYDLLEHFSNNFLRSLNRNSKDLSPVFIDMNKNLIKSFRCLIKSDKAQVKFLLNSGKPIVFRKWIEKKLK